MIKMKHISGITLAVCMIACAAALSGCKQDKPKPAPAPVAEKPKPQPVGLGQIKSELLEAKTQIDATTASLNTLQKSAAADAQANYNKFTEEYLKMQAKADALKARSDDLKSKTAAYYATWNKQMEVANPELRSQALQQKVQAEQVFNSISSEMQLARISFDPYMANLKDVGNYLRGNLSPASLNSAGDLATKASAQAKNTNSHIDAIVANIDKMSAATGEGAATPAVPAAAPVAPAAK
jgi:hypothetical protein